MKPVTRYDLRQIGPYLYEVPVDFRHDMRVPAHFYADAGFLAAALEDRSLEQLVNTATLPGIVGQAMAMPDIHQGYGFPIGGVAATRLPDGVISPGGVGYDINCLSGDSLVLHQLGYTTPIAEMEPSWGTAQLRCQDFHAHCEAETGIQRYISLRTDKAVYRLRTQSGREIVATEDHPFWTPDGMTPLGELAIEREVAVHGFDGVPFERPSDDIIVTQADVEAELRMVGKDVEGNALAQVLRYLDQRKLLPLRYSSPALPHLLRMMGVVWGDGSIQLSASRKGLTAIYGKVEDLEEMQRDIQAIGFRPSRVYARTRHHTVQTKYRAYEFEHVETWVKVSSTAFAVLLATLGVPTGNKTTADWRLPGWLMKAPLWQKRLFLGSLFGAEMNAPGTITGHDLNFAAPTISLNKREQFAGSGEAWLQDIAALLADFSIRTLPVARRAEQINADGSRSIRLRLTIATTPANLRLFWSRVGFECHREKRALASVAVTYLRLKERIVAQRNEVAAQAVQMQAAGFGVGEIKATLGGATANERFIERSLFAGRLTGARAGQTFPSFTEFLAVNTRDLGRSGMAWDRVTAIEPVLDSAGAVYDFTVAHPDHNFVANGFVVSNCGVRVLGTQLDVAEIRPFVEKLADGLYRNLPSGVGVKGHLHINKTELDRILAEGSRWAQREGYARPEDVAHTEEEGRMAGADPGKVSKSAKERGLEQVGTLGSGNHFAELDVVTEIYDAAAADALDLRVGQVAVQIHCGSRGLGHQVATDYIQEFQRASRRFGYDLPDRQLVCAPLDSLEGQSYLAAMNAAANYAWANRQVLTHYVRETFAAVLSGRVHDPDLFLVYDVAHNMAKIEQHEVAGQGARVCVHRKGATRAFGPGHADVPEDYRALGQPVLVPGSMGTASYVLVGTAESMQHTFGSCCHGAGRVLSRADAKRLVRGEQLRQNLAEEGITVRAGSLGGLAEEAPQAYKDVDRVVAVVEAAGIARLVARLEPMAVVKG
jgi:tRNA-splicing ligase RtcB